MMSRRINAEAVAAAIQNNFASTLRESGQLPSEDASPQGSTRSTFKSPSEAIIELRTLALQNGCTMNDVILIAISDLLTAAGRPCAIQVKPGLRDRIIGKARRTHDTSGGLA
jgi:hypothetical protein